MHYRLQSTGLSTADGGRSTGLGMVASWNVSTALTRLIGAQDTTKTAMTTSRASDTLSSSLKWVPRPARSRRPAAPATLWAPRWSEFLVQRVPDDQQRQRHFELVVEVSHSCSAFQTTSRASDTLSSSLKWVPRVPDDQQSQWHFELVAEPSPSSAFQLCPQLCRQPPVDGLDRGHTHGTRRSYQQIVGQLSM